MNLVRSSPLRAPSAIVFQTALASFGGISWAEGPGRNGFFVSAYSASSREGNEAIRAELEEAGVRAESGLPASLQPRVVAFVDAGSVDHNDFVTSAWGGAPLRDIFARIGG
jgi:hypothetical protein